MALLAGLGLAIVALTCAVGPAFDQYDEEGFVAVGLVIGLLAFAATWIARDAPERWALVVIVVVAVTIRLIALSDDPLVSTDVYRYVWDGRVQGAGINPYRYIPADPALLALQDADIFPNINRANYAVTAYPPFAEAFFYFVTRLSDTLDGMRIAFLGCEAAAVGLLMVLLTRLGRPRTLVVAYLWHPLSVWEIANAGHVDALVMLLVLGALVLLTSKRRILGALAIAAAVLVKPYVIVLLGAFWRPWDWRAPAFVILLVAFFYSLYLSVGTGVLGFVPMYLHEEGFVAGNGFWLVSLVRRFLGDVPGILPFYLSVGAMALGLATLRILFKPAFYRPAEQIRDVVALMFIGLFVLSPNYPWYYLPLVPFLAVFDGSVLWVTTLLASLLHAWWPTPDDQPTRFLIWKTVLNLGSIAALIVTWAQARRRTATPASSEAPAPSLTDAAVSAAEPGA
ncbi:MAG: glycosyltransferase 87 family protein [Ancalomicrobiaceae bacterium]|nr:glycosyltransferase 87 family protein [Ancalomicrobiaceae bacterium]